MNLEGLGQVIAKAAPLLGGVIAGPAGAAIGSVVAAKFGASVEDTKTLIQRIESDPEASTKLLEIQSRHEVELQRLTFEIARTQLRYAYLSEKKAYDDRANARFRETEQARAGQHDRTPAILAYLLTAGVFTALYFLFIHEVPENNKELIVGIISAMSAVWVAAMAYYHGSSSSSRSKDNFLWQKEPGGLNERVLIKKHDAPITSSS